MTQININNNQTNNSKFYKGYEYDLGKEIVYLTLFSWKTLFTILPYLYYETLDYKYCWCILWIYVGSVQTGGFLYKYFHFRLLKIFNLQSFMSFESRMSLNIPLILSGVIMFICNPKYNYNYYNHWNQFIKDNTIISAIDVLLVHRLFLYILFPFLHFIMNILINK